MKEHLKKADLLGLAIIAAALVAYSVRSIWTVYQTAAVIAGAALVLISIALKLGSIREGLGRRSTRFGINSATSVVLLVGILALVNYLGAQNEKRVDLTTEKMFSLSDQSVQVTGQIQEDVRIKAFFPGGDDQITRDLLNLYNNQNGRIAYEFIDPDKQPLLAQQYQVTTYGSFTNPMSGQTVQYGTVLLEMGQKSERVEKQSEPLREEDVTNALMKLIKGETKTIYFTEGHGEKAIDNTERGGYASASAELQEENYVVRKLNLVVEGKVPDDASVVVVAGPTSEPFPNELELLDTYLQNGGSVLLLLDPAPAASLADFAKKWSIDVGNNVVVDPSGVGRLFGAGPAMPLVASYGPHPITERFRTMTFFPLVRSVQPGQPPVEGLSVEQLLSTNEQSWGETNLTSGEAERDDADLSGPVSIGVVASKDLPENKKVRLVVIGDSDFGQNDYLGLQGNGNLFVNTVAWLAQDESFISIRAKDPADRPLTMTESQGRLFAYVAVFLLPGSILAAGISVWMKRRK
jgi:ABC-type uncharacterized transport system involved in gliding motility auxiliary subunit